VSSPLMTLTYEERGRFYCGRYGIERSSDGWSFIECPPVVETPTLADLEALAVVSSAAARWEPR